MDRRVQAMVLVALASAGVAFGWFVPHPSGDAAQFTDPQADAAVVSPAFPRAKFNWVGGGTFRVATQAPPGEYMVTATDTTFGCRWQLLKALDEKPKSVIDEGKVFRGDFAVVVVTRSAKYFKLTGNCTWDVGS